MNCNIIQGDDNMEPYKQGIIPSYIYYKKVKVSGKINSIMNACLDNRGLKLIEESTRAFKKYDLIEIIVTKESKFPGERVNSIAYIGFIEVENGGVIRIGDKFIVNKKSIGQVLGFDATHMPNHYNLVINVNDLITGYDLGLKLGDKAEFIHYQ